MTEEAWREKRDRRESIMARLIAGQIIVKLIREYSKSQAFELKSTRIWRKIIIDLITIELNNWPRQ